MIVDMQPSPLKLPPCTRSLFRSIKMKFIKAKADTFLLKLLVPQTSTQTIAQIEDITFLLEGRNVFVKDKYH